MPLAPSIGSLFEYRGRNYRLTGYLKPARLEKPKASCFDDILDEILFDSAFEREGVKFVHCSREEAEYVTGYGVCGCIARIVDVRVIGRVNWPEEQIKEAEDSHKRRIGRLVL